MRRGAIHLCQFSTTDDLVESRMTYEDVKAAVLAAGRFSAFEASATAKRGRLFTRLSHDPDLVLTDSGYPWTGVRSLKPSVGETP